MFKQLLCIVCVSVFPLVLQAQRGNMRVQSFAEPFVQSKAEQKMQSFAEGIEYRLEAQSTVSNNSTPFWLASNKYGLASVKENFGFVRAALQRNTEADSLKDWRFGFGIDAVAGYGLQKEIFIQQFYAEAAWKKLRLSVGIKEREARLKPNALSLGSQTLGINARPIPEVRLEVSDYASIVGKGKWLSVKGHFAYGILTDSDWQEEYVANGFSRNSDVLYHSKAGYLKIGNEERFPLTFEGGLEMVCYFGGKVYNFNDHPIDMSMTAGAKDFCKVFFFQGSDVTDGDYSNALGNTFGSWLLRLNYHGDNWRVSAYLDHFFEDHSLMFFEYGWKDGLVGIEACLPCNPVLGTMVYEFMNTTYQSGPIYHDHTASIPDQISGRDKYYSHYLYNGPLHWGQAIGNPLYISPLYMKNGRLTFPCTRFRAHHVGLSGTPHPSLSYRMLYTHSLRLGTYDAPLLKKIRQNSFLCELTYSPGKLRSANLQGWSATLSFAFDKGQFIGNNTGFQLTIAKRGFLIK